MAVLARWAAPGGDVTLRASALTKHPFLDGMVVLLDVRGVSDPEHPSVEVHSLTVRQADLRYVCEGREVAAAAQDAPAAPVPAPAPVPPVDAPTRRRAQP